MKARNLFIFGICFALLLGVNFIVACESDDEEEVDTSGVDSCKGYCNVWYDCGWKTLEEKPYEDCVDECEAWRATVPDDCVTCDYSCINQSGCDLAGYQDCTQSECAGTVCPDA